MERKFAVGVDVGGGHVEASIADLMEYKIVEGTNIYRKIENTADAESILTAWAEAINQAVEKALETGHIHKEEIQGIGIAMPNPFNYQMGISLMEHKFLALYTCNVRKELAIRTDFRQENIRFKNDAESFMLGEILKRKNEDIKEAVGVTLGTGFGSAFYTDNESKDGNLWCAPYRGKTAERYISSAWFIEQYKERTGKEITGVLYLTENFDTDEHAQQIFKEFGETLEDFLVPLATELRADALILGGSISKSAKRFTAALEQALPSTTKLFVTECTEESAMIGAASLLQD